MAINWGKRTEELVFGRPNLIMPFMSYAICYIEQVLEACLLGVVISGELHFRTYLVYAEANLFDEVT